VSQSKPVLEIIGVDKHFGAQHVLKNCSLNVVQGETVVLIGPSGSGKSTLLRCINLLEPIQGGVDLLSQSGHHPRQYRAA